MADQIITLTGSVTVTAQTVKIPAQTVPVSISVDLTTLAAAVAQILAPPVVVTPPPPPPPPPPTGTSYSVYSNGVLGGGDGNWVSNFNNAADTVNPKDTSQPYPGQQFDLKLTIGEQWGMWLPYSNNPPQSFPMAPYKTVEFDVLAPKDNAPASIAFIPAGDETSPLALTVQFPNAKYGPEFSATSYVHVSIPVADFGIPNFPGENVYKFGFQDQSGTVGGVWRFANVEFKG